MGQELYPFLGAAVAKPPGLDVNRATPATAVMVLGMHRAGTSVLTGLLECCGVDLGDNLFQAQQGVNEKGFWENAAAVAINDDLLFGLGSGWDDWLPLAEDWLQSDAADQARQSLLLLLRRQFSEAPLWGVKDPRVCRLVPLWRDVLGELSCDVAFLLPVRAPQAVAASLARRDGFVAEKGLLLWLAHVLEAELHTRGQRRAVIMFEDTLESPGTVHAQLCSWLGAESLPELDSFQQAAAGLVSDGLKHHGSDLQPPPGAVGELASRCYRALRLEAEEAGTGLAELDLCREQFNALIAATDPVLLQHIRHLGAERGRYHLLWRRIQRLRSWRWTGALRALERRLRGL